MMIRAAFFSHVSWPIFRVLRDFFFPSLFSGVFVVFLVKIPQGTRTSATLNTAHNNSINKILHHCKPQREIEYLNKIK